MQAAATEAEVAEITDRVMKAAAAGGVDSAILTGLVELTDATLHEWSRPGTTSEKMMADLAAFREVARNMLQKCVPALRPLFERMVYELTVRLSEEIATSRD